MERSTRLTLLLPAAIQAAGPWASGVQSTPEPLVALPRHDEQDIGIDTQRRVSRRSIAAQRRNTRRCDPAVRPLGYLDGERT